MTQRIPYMRFTSTGVIFSLLIAVLIIAPNRMFKEIDVFDVLGDYLISAAVLFLVWSLNILALRIFATGNDIHRASRQRIALSFIVVVGIILLFHYILDFNKPPPPRYNAPNPTGAFPINHGWIKIVTGILTGFSLNLLVVVSIEVLLLRNSKTVIEADNIKLREEKLQAVNLMLKQQIQPHFLFNSLNTLKSLINRNTDKAEDYLLKLSEFLRGSISTGDKALVSVNEELTLCSNYLELQSVRFGDALIHKFNISKETKDSGLVPPFSIQLLIENAIKHNMLTEALPLSIEITEESGWIKVNNNLQLRSTKEESTGIGLANLTARYASIANEKVVINPTVTKFEVMIKIL